MATAEAASSLPGRSAYRADIDGLRAFAILAVVAFHAFPQFLHGGFTGVDIFFVISGFLIAGIVLRECREGTFTIAGFYSRRVRRLFPALVVVLAACLLAGMLVLFDVEYARLGRHAAFGAFGLANFSLFAETGYFAPAAETNLLLHLWSLGVEEQFYLLLPATVLLVRGRRSLGIAFGSMLLGSLWLSLDRGRLFSSDAKFYLPWFRAWELMAGVLLAYVELSRQAAPGPGRARLRDALSVLGLLVLVVAVSRGRNQQPWNAALPAVIGTVLVIAAGPGACVNRWLLSHRLLVFIGLVSYPLYLWHWPVLAFSRIVWLEPGTGGRLAAVAVAMVLAVLTWACVERPVRFGRSHLRAPRRLAALMAGVALMSAGVVWAGGRVGWTAPVDSRVFALADTRDPACRDRFWGPDGEDVWVDCSNPRAPSDPSVAVVGDSHAQHLYAGLAAYYAKHGQDVVSLSANGCAVAPEQPVPERCERFYRKAFDKIAHLDSIKTVVLSEYMPIMRRKDRPNWAAEARKLAQRLTAQGKRVVFVIDVPWLEFEPRLYCQRRPFMTGSASELEARCALPRARYEERVPEFRPRIAAAFAGLPGVVVFDLPAKLCDARVCHAMVDGVPLYRDDHHLNTAGSQYVARFYDWESR